MANTKEKKNVYPADIITLNRHQRGGLTIQFERIVVEKNKVE